MIAYRKYAQSYGILKSRNVRHKFSKLYLHRSGHLNSGQQLSNLSMDNPALTSTAILENYYARVASYYGDSSYKVSRSLAKGQVESWACKIAVKWPTNREFYAEASKKVEATRIASHQALDWLKSNDVIDDDGKPVLVKNLASVPLKLDARHLEAISRLSVKYDNEIKPFFEEYEALHANDIQRYLEDTNIPSYADIPEVQLKLRNIDLINRLHDRLPKTNLPIDPFENQIIETIENNRVVVIKGATGSGKTTRVPQFIFDYYIKQNRGIDCNIVITQPRRISATSVSTRIATERGENIGFSIGHHVRFSVLYPCQPGTIVFMSTGILLQRLLLDPMLSNISHVIIDEAHERDLNIDLLLLLMKELISRNDQIRLVIMSATINAELFQKYFDNCPLLSIPGFMYNVDTHFIDGDVMSQYFDKSAYEYDQKDIDDSLFIDVVNWIHSHKPPGAILVFLPGWSNISKIQSILQRNNELVVLTAHSKLKIEQQQLIFDPVPEGRRKVILATNIAESSITIPDVVYVVDSGIIRMSGVYGGVSGLVNSWISKAVADQRRGRAGRVQEGECYRLYSKKKYESFLQYPIPEVFRMPLHSLVLKTKTFSEERPRDMLLKLPECPPEERIEEAVCYLRHITVLDDKEQLTPLGRRIAMFGLDPLLSVALVYSAFFGCIDPMLFLSSYLNGDASLFSVDTNASKRRMILSNSHPTNDQLALYRIYNSLLKNNSLPFFSHEDISALNPNSIETFKKVLHLNLDNLFKARLVGTKEMIGMHEGTLGEESNVNFVAPVLLAATGRLAVNSKPYFSSGKANYFLNTVDGFKVQIASESVNFKSRTSSSFYTFYKMNTVEGFYRIYDTAEVSAVAAILFCPYYPVMYTTNNSDIVNVTFPNVELPIEAKQNEIQALLHIRGIIWSSINFFVRYHDNSIEQNELVKQFETELCQLLSKLLDDNN